MGKTTTTLVLGGTGATGQLLIRQLIEKDQNVKTIVRSKDKLLNECLGDVACNINNDKLTVIEGAILKMSDDEVKSYIDGCDAVVSCLGHNLTMKGMYGKPRKLVKDSLQKICDVVKQLNSTKIPKIILMGSDGVANPDGSDDVRSIGDRIILSILRVLLPPHVDNEAAAEYLSQTIGTGNPKLQWVVVRPSDLIDADVSGYDLLSKPSGSLFGSAETSRANVAAFMSKLILEEDDWEKWLFQFPVILNKKSEQLPSPPRK